VPASTLRPYLRPPGRNAIEVKDRYYQRKAGVMTALLRRDSRTIFPELMDWFEEPFLTLRPYLTQPIKVEDYVEEDKYMIRAELPGIDPEHDVEVTTGAGYLTIRAERHDKAESKHRTEFRYGSFTRTLVLPATADQDAVTASYEHGILTVTVPVKPGKKETVKKIEVSAIKK
jgi:HSP20 family protein